MNSSVRPHGRPTAVPLHFRVHCISRAFLKPSLFAVLCLRCYVLCSNLRVSRPFKFSTLSPRTEIGAALHAEPGLDLPLLELPGGAQARADGAGERGVPGGRLMYLMVHTYLKYWSTSLPGAQSNMANWYVLWLARVAEMA